MHCDKKKRRRPDGRSNTAQRWCASLSAVFGTFPSSSYVSGRLVKTHYQLHNHYPFKSQRRSVPLSRPPCIATPEELNAWRFQPLHYRLRNQGACLAWKLYLRSFDGPPPPPPLLPPLPPPPPEKENCLLPSSSSPSSPDNIELPVPDVMSCHPPGMNCAGR